MNSQPSAAVLPCSLGLPTHFSTKKTSRQSGCAYGTGFPGSKTWGRLGEEHVRVWFRLVSTPFPNGVDSIGRIGWGLGQTSVFVKVVVLKPQPTRSSGWVTPHEWD